MKLPKICFILVILSLVLAAGANAADLPYHHVHLTATDPVAAAEWYVKYMGGEIVGEGDRVLIGDVLILFFKKPEGFEGSAGSSVDHIGFSFPDLEAKMAAYRDAGIPVVAEVREVPGKFKFAFVEDPWGTKIEVMEDPETLGFHHIHLRGPEPVQTLDWYQDTFGGTRTKYKDMLDAVKYGEVWLLAQNAPERQAPTRGRAIDHLGWSTKDLKALETELKGKGVTFTLDPIPYGKDLMIAFVEGPHGVNIELVQTP